MRVRVCNEEEMLVLDENLGSGEPVQWPFRVELTPRHEVRERADVARRRIPVSSGFQPRCRASASPNAPTSQNR
jgi:hypothetical protein